MQPAHEAAADFLLRRQREQRRYRARKPKKIADVLAQLITARGYGRIQADADFTTAWQQAAGEVMSQFTRPGRLRRGTLEVTATNSAIVQELTFQKQQILTQLNQHLPDANIRDIRFRIGGIS